MKVLTVTILCLFFSTNLFAASNAAVATNNDRLNLMTEILSSNSVVDLLNDYGNKNFVFDGMNWVNSFSDLKIYKLKFKKFTLQIVEDTFIMTTTTCDHLVFLKFGKFVGDKEKACKESQTIIPK